MTMASNSMTMPMSDPSAWATAMSNLGMPPISMTGQQLMPGTIENVLHAATEMCIVLYSENIDVGISVPQLIKKPEFVGFMSKL